MAPRVASSAGPRLLRVEQLTLYSRVAAPPFAAGCGFTEARFVDVSTSPGEGATHGSFCLHYNMSHTVLSPPYV